VNWISERAQGRFLAIWLALATLLLLSPLIAPTSVSRQSLNNLIFFGSMLGLVALGQHLVIVVGGLDLSVPATITLAGLVFADMASDSVEETALAVAAALLAALCVGLLNGLTVTVLRITPLIATLGVGAIARGTGFLVHGTGSPDAVPDFFNKLATSRPVFGVFSIAAVIWLISTLLVILIFRLTVAGRRFVAVGDSPHAARAAGIHVDAYKIAGYMAGAFFYGIAGLVLAGVASHAGRTLGDPYLLPPIAAVVVAGTPLGGGIGSVAATAAGALFMTHLDSLTLSMKAPRSVQLIVQGATIALAMGLYRLRFSPANLRIWPGRAKVGPKESKTEGEKKPNET
jgi:ribose transport system permease protein